MNISFYFYYIDCFYYFFHLHFVTSTASSATQPSHMVPSSNVYTVVFIKLRTCRFLYTCWTHSHRMVFFALFITFIILLAWPFFHWIQQKKIIVSKYDDNKKLLHLNDYPIIGASLRFIGDGEGRFISLFILFQLGSHNFNL